MSKPESKIFKKAKALAEQNNFEFKRITPAKLLNGTLQHFTTYDKETGEFKYHYGYHSILSTLNREVEEEEEYEEDEECQEDYEFTAE